MLALPDVDEIVADLWRDRYRIGADSVSRRPKRKGKDWKQLRRYAALVVECVRIAYLAQVTLPAVDGRLACRRASEEELARAAVLDARRRAPRRGRRNTADPPS